MALELTASTSPDVQQDLAGATDAVLTWTSRAYAAGELITIDSMGNWDSGTPSVTNHVIPSGGGTWTLITRTSSISAGGTATSAWYYIVPGGGQTFAITQTTQDAAGVSNISSRGVMRRYTGADPTTPIGAIDVFAASATDPLTSAASLELLNVLAGSRICASGVDWTDSATVTTSFDSGIARTEDINAREVGQVHFIAIRSTDPLPANDASIRAGFDVSGGAGNWSAVMYEIKAAASAAPGPPPLRRTRPFMQLKMR